LLIRETITTFTCHRISFVHISKIYCMKLFYSTLAFLSFFISAYSQPKTITREEYSMKSKQQQTAGWVCLGVGSLLVGTGAMVSSGAGDDLSSLGQSAAGGALSAVGLASVIVSIPLFIASHKNKRRAAALGLVNEKVSAFNVRGFSTRMYPAISFKLKL
jgi:mannose/fructose/N-acetylgalactosamine-specific phosphotransferase system component IIC